MPVIWIDARHAKAALKVQIETATARLASQLALVSAAIQKQTSRDFGPLWNVEATVDGFDKLEDVLLQETVSPPSAQHRLEADAASPAAARE